MHVPASTHTANFESGILLKIIEIDLSGRYSDNYEKKGNYEKKDENEKTKRCVRWKSKWVSEWVSKQASEKKRDKWGGKRKTTRI